MLLFSTKFSSEIAAALDLATSTPLTEGGRKTQRALYYRRPKRLMLFFPLYSYFKLVISWYFKKGMETMVRFQSGDSFKFLQN